MLQGETTLSAEHLRGDRVGSEHPSTHQITLGKTTVVHEHLQKVDTADHRHIDVVVLPVLDQLGKQVQIGELIFIQLFLTLKEGIDCAFCGFQLLLFPDDSRRKPLEELYILSLSHFHLSLSYSAWVSTAFT